MGSSASASRPPSGIPQAKTIPSKSSKDTQNMVQKRKSTTNQGPGIIGTDVMVSYSHSDKVVMKRLKGGCSILYSDFAACLSAMYMEFGESGEALELISHLISPLVMFHCLWYRWFGVAWYHSLGGRCWSPGWSWLSQQDRTGHHWFQGGTEMCYHTYSNSH